MYNRKPANSGHQLTSAFGLLVKATRVWLAPASIFELPGLNKLRSRLYGAAFGCAGMNVGRGVIITSAHRSGSAAYRFGPGLRIGAGAYLDCSGGIDIGETVQISEGVRIYTHEHRVDEHVDIRRSGIDFNSLRIEAYAWIGSNVIVTASCGRIGRRAMIAAGSIVTCDVPGGTIVGGIPAKVLRKRACQG